MEEKYSEAGAVAGGNPSVTADAVPAPLIGEPSCPGTLAGSLPDEGEPTKALPEDWTIGMTIAPEGADVGLPEEYGYNYLMKTINRAVQGLRSAGGFVEMVTPLPAEERSENRLYGLILADYTGGEE